MHSPETESQSQGIMGSQKSKFNLFYLTSITKKGRGGPYQHFVPTCRKHNTKNWLHEDVGGLCLWVVSCSRYFGNFMTLGHNLVCVFFFTISYALLDGSAHMPLLLYFAIVNKLFGVKMPNDRLSSYPSASAWSFRCNKKVWMFRKASDQE